MSDKKPGRRSISLNRRAEFEFELETKYEAGMVLTGSEVKSMRAGKVTLDGSWVEFHQGRPVLQGAHIAIFLQANRYNHEPARPRPLLLHWMESQKLHQLVKEKGVTLVPLELYWQRGKAKLQIGLAKGKKQHDKRATEKDRDWQRDKARLLRRG